MHVLPRCIPVCKALDNVCEDHTHTSDLHFNFRANASVCDIKYYKIDLIWLKSHSRFGLVSILAGVVANADEAFTIGKSVA